MTSDTHRYRLSRRWDETGPVACWIMLNPSTATETMDDPTIRRVAGFSRRWGFGSLVVVNLFALRSTSPSLLTNHPDPVGPGNDAAILSAVDTADLVVAAWGNHGARPNPITRAPRDEETTRLLGHRRLHCLGTTATGRPRHPLYLPSTTRPVPLRDVA